MNILGISDVTGNHSHSCVALLQDGELTFALSQERISRQKNDPRFPHEALGALFDFSGLRPEEINFFACSYPPADYYGSLLRDNKLDLPRSFASTLIRTPLRLSKYLVPNIRKALFDPKASNGLFDMGVPENKFRFYDHHLCHVSAGYFTSRFDDCLAISYGGFAPHIDGQNVAGAVYRCQGKDISHLEDIPMCATGCYYSGVTVALGFNYMQQEGKTMGLSGHGDWQVCYDQEKKLTTQFQDGQWNAYPYWVDYIMSPRSEVYLGTRSGRAFTRLIRNHGAENVAAAVQKIWEDNILSFVSHLAAKYQCPRFVLSGGTFLNVQIVKKILELPEVEDVFVHPHTGDGSTTIGALVEAHRDLTGNPVRLPLPDVGLGLEFPEEQIETAIRAVKGDYEIFRPEDISHAVAESLADGQTVGWFQGREEYGHRSLGHRCILGDPRSVGVKGKITSLIKGRENFIPIAPSVLAEEGSTFFQDFSDSPYMSRAYQVIPPKAGDIPAALHINGTARAQAVGEQQYKPFRRLIEHFYHITAIPMVLNTSFNRHGEPMVHRPEEALELFLQTEMDQLAIGPFLLKKRNQKK